ncbi:glycoside hydrolase family 78 protein [Sunxiuqinia dokdonensis]|uniref:alpha-L-rhamnosidase n=1 Tax=Sunxiuqinia dokdonensis TaxID=1409788 RepID=A0A0L8VE28_9BACT|nr:glycoside hydrolase family 78 protein [Sunxiuqinia dokdonensis]KOH46701.1 alpha-rhamnosidase [Sunxiuqinia dokdonensis]
MSKINLILAIVFLLACSFSAFSQSTVTKLQCEYLENPLGIDEPSPRFTWQLVAKEAGSKQQAYQIVVGTDEADVSSGSGNVWVSGTISSGTIPAIYQGPELNPFTRYYWRVRIQDESGNWSDWSPIAWFETGLMQQTNWKGHWISDTHDYKLKPAPYFRKAFNTNKQIRSARAYIAVAGLYELSINGERIGDHRLDPAYTRFDRRNLYVTYDVTNKLQQGENVLGVLLGNGWYNHQSTAVWYFDQAPWRARPKFCMDLRITYHDGSEEIVSTGSDWQTSLSPVIFNSIYTAEHYDARLEQAGWDSPGFKAEGWRNAMLTNAPSQNITAQVLHPIRHVTEIPAVRVTRQGEKTWLFDFGRNMAGVTSIQVSGAEGTTIRLKHVERLDADGKADPSNIDVHYRPTDDSDPFQTDIFILSGKGEEHFMPRFNYKGFQYVEVTSDQPLELTQESLTAYFMHSDVPPSGTVHSSNTTLNKAWEAANASYLSNLYGYPTDCPQREKNGWTGDAHIAIETGLYNFDGITVYEKWLADHRDEQQPNGVLPAIIPTDGWGYTWANGPDWTSTIAIIPWNIYLFYGDSRLLERCYDNIKRYVDHIDELYPSGLTDWGLGDWVPVKSQTPKEFTSSAYYYVDALILSKAAKILGKEADSKHYASLAEKIKQAVNAKYLDRETGLYGSGLQTELSVALHWGLVPEEVKAKVAENLAKRVEADDKHIDVGLLGTKAILNALSENGYPELAWEVASQETFPSWGWWIVNGATTFYENWPLDAKSDISMNHIMFGEISAWYYKALGGIFPDEEQPGFKNILLKPNFVKGLDQFEATHESPYGTIVSSWKRNGRTVEYQVSVPANSTATLQLRGAKVEAGGKNLTKNTRLKILEENKNQVILELDAGDYHFSIR